MATLAANKRTALSMRYVYLPNGPYQPANQRQHTAADDHRLRFSKTGIVVVQ